MKMRWNNYCKLIKYRDRFMAYYAPRALLRSAPGILDKYPHMVMVLGLMENRFDGV